MTAENRPGVLALRGQELSGVAFVRDYVEFHFDGPVLRAFVGPDLVRAQAPDLRFPDSGSRDALCALIGNTVREVRFEEQRTLELDFGPVGLVRVSLDSPGPHREAATFQRELIHSALEVY